MKEINNFDKQNMFELIDSLGIEINIAISLIGWEDGDWFFKLCEEDGGIIPEHYKFFKTMPLGLRMNNRNELKAKIIEVFDKPFLQSHNGKYKFHYDLHVWMGKFYFVYNAYLKKIIIKKLNIFNRLLGCCILPSWQNKKFNY